MLLLNYIENDFFQGSMSPSRTEPIKKLEDTIFVGGHLILMLLKEDYRTLPCDEGCLMAVKDTHLGVNQQPHVQRTQSMCCQVFLTAILQMILRPLPRLSVMHWDPALSELQP